MHWNLLAAPTHTQTKTFKEWYVHDLGELNEME